MLVTDEILKYIVLLTDSGPVRRNPPSISYNLYTKLFVKNTNYIQYGFIIFLVVSNFNFFLWSH